MDLFSNFNDRRYVRKIKIHSAAATCINNTSPTASLLSTSATTTSTDSLAEDCNIIMNDINDMSDAVKGNETDTGSSFSTYSVNEMLLKKKD